MAIDKVAHIKAELAKISSIVEPTPKEDAIFIKCPYHGGGRERTPSNKINIKSNKAPIGFSYCFGCKAKNSWNNLAATLGIAGFKKADEVHDVYSFTMSTPEERKTLEDLHVLKRWKEKPKWRTITLETLRKFDARLTQDESFKRNYSLYLPVVVRDDYVGGIYCREVMNKTLKRQGAISYINTKGRFTKRALFGFNIAKKRKRQPLWIVEGPRDCMKVVQLGGRAVAILGSYFGEEKAKLIEALDPPYIIVATDPDDAGNIAAKAIKKLLPMIPQYRVKFPEGKDPAQMRMKTFRRIMKRSKKHMAAT